MTLKKIFKSTEISDFRKVRLVRHQDKNIDIQKLIKNGVFEIYQSFQKSKCFDCDYIIVFIGGISTTAIFHRVYKVIQKKNASDVRLEKPEYEIFRNGSGVWYELLPIDDYSDLSGRLVINWGKSTLSWYQNFKEKEIIEILPKGYIKEFPGYLNFTLTFDELVQISKNQFSNRTWVEALKRVAGIYLILNTKDGTQYVGKASGKDGIWGRWLSYSNDGHGGNILLEQLVNEDNTNFPTCFQYTILYTFTTNASADEISSIETLYKKKLGSRVFGLNEN